MIRSLFYLLTLLSVTNFLPKIFAIQEANAAFWVYYLIFHLLTFPYFLIRKELLPLMAGGIAIFYYSVQFTHLYYPTPKYSMLSSIDNHPEEISILYFNSYIKNRNTDSFESSLQELNPDIVMLLESDKDWVGRVKGLSNYKYQSAILDKEVWSMGVFSKIPFVMPPEVSLGDDIQPVITGIINKNNLHFSLIHASPPHTPDAVLHNRKIVRRLATQIRHSRDNWVLIGDFNSTPFGRTYENVIEAARMDDGLNGFGLLKTWPTFIPYIGFHIDRVFVKNQVSVQNMKTVPISGSDHLGMFLRLNVGLGPNS